MPNRKNKKKLRSAARKLSDAQLIRAGEVMLDRVDSGDNLDEMQKYTLKTIDREIKKRSQENEKNV